MERTNKIFIPASFVCVLVVLLLQLVMLSEIMIASRQMDEVMDYFDGFTHQNFRSFEDFDD